MNRIFIHGLLGSGQGFKGNFLRQRFPDMLTPDFPGTLDERMRRLGAILAQSAPWILVGSSLGGLMATMAAAAHPERIRRMVLLAPALIWPDFVRRLPPPIAVPTIIYHGRNDPLIPLLQVRPLIEQVFTHATLHEVDDDHMLHATMPLIPWEEYLAE
ncbi:MAG: alpha/beta hydrolase [Chloroflexi bacterium]|nr:alpha/beta hydrolase [Chloroflexota bacterium]